MRKNVNISSVFIGFPKKCCCGWETVVRPPTVSQPQQHYFRKTYKTTSKIDTFCLEIKKTHKNTWKINIFDSQGVYPSKFEPFGVLPNSKDRAGHAGGDCDTPGAWNLQNLFQKHDLLQKNWKFACDLGFAGYVFSWTFPPRGRLSYEAYKVDTKSWNECLKSLFKLMIKLIILVYLQLFS